MGSRVLGLRKSLLALEGDCVQSNQKMGETHAVGAGPKRSFKQYKRIRPKRVKKFQRAWTTTKIGDPGASSSVAGPHDILGQPHVGSSAKSELGLLGKAPISAGIGLSGMMDGVLHLGPR